jgi:GT2 family glycosyltransferase
VTAACLMIERSKLESVDGFDERFTIGGGDVALGLALHERGLWNVMTPYARLIHHESQSRGTVVPDSDLVLSRTRYRPYVGGRDPFYNPNLSLADTSVSIAHHERGDDQPH